MERIPQYRQKYIVLLPAKKINKKNDKNAKYTQFKVKRLTRFIWQRCKLQPLSEHFEDFSQFSQMQI